MFQLGLQTNDSSIVPNIESQIDYLWQVQIVNEYADRFSFEFDTQIAAVLFEKLICVICSFFTLGEDAGRKND